MPGPKPPIDGAKRDTIRLLQSAGGARLNKADRKLFIRTFAITHRNMGATNDSELIFWQACKMGRLEGIVSKRRDLAYRPVAQSAG